MRWVDEFLTVAEVAELLKLNQMTIRNWISSGQLPAVRLGARRVRIKRADLLVESGDSGADLPRSQASLRCGTVRFQSRTFPESALGRGIGPGCGREYRTARSPYTLGRSVACPKRRSAATFGVPLANLARS